jgi:ankyrin repeat protein
METHHCIMLLHSNGHIEIARLLLQNGADVNVRNNYGSTPLHCAAYNGHIDILHLLFENGADLEAQSNNGERALHYAARFGHLPIIQDLISRYHVDINARRNGGTTALWLARHGEPHLTPSSYCLPSSKWWY